MVTALTCPNGSDDSIASVAHANLSARLAGIRVLLAEDNPTNQMIALTMLGRLGCETELVADGVEVLRRLDETNYDIVLMDVQMPRMDGRQATLEIRRREAAGWSPPGVSEGLRARLPVVAMTANVSEGDRERCLAAQMDDYLRKPVTMDHLARVLEHWVERAGQDAVVPATRAAQRDSSVPILRRERLEEISQGDADFEREFLGCLLSDIAAGLERLQTALDPLDPARVAGLLHGIVGACRTVGADALGQVARAAEDQTKRPGFAPGPDWLAPVEAARDHLIAAVHNRLNLSDR